MLEIRQARPFTEWLAALQDVKGRAVIARRIERLSLGNFGDYKSVGGGVNELRIDSASVTACTSRDAELKSSFCFAVETRHRRQRISLLPKR